MGAALRITNREARRLWLHAQLLSDTPTGPLDLAQTTRSLGFVQLDTIQVVTRAHHHILWSRNQNYREPMLDKLLARERAVFEHFTHDASVIPMEFYPMWTRQFARLEKKVSGYAAYRKACAPSHLADIKRRISEEGPLSTHDFDTKIEGKKQMWDRPPHKRALDYLWYAGELATSHRRNFTKYYDLSERVIPEAVRETHHEDEHQLDWLCCAALDRLGFGSQGEIQRFWGAANATEVRNWLDANAHKRIAVKVQAADRSWFSAFAPPDIEARLQSATAPTSRLRIINPFDPVVRDRDRLERLFGFEYRNEMFVPAADRKWGYYVYPLLEGDRFVGRIEVKADRKNGWLRVLQIWKEPKVKWTSSRSQKLDAELERLARLIDVRKIEWICPRL